LVAVVAAAVSVIAAGLSFSLLLSLFAAAAKAVNDKT